MGENPISLSLAYIEIILLNMKRIPKHEDIIEMIDAATCIKKLSAIIDHPQRISILENTYEKFKKYTEISKKRAGHLMKQIEESIGIFMNQTNKEANR
jgi:hypothetical protein